MKSVFDTPWKLVIQRFFKPMMAFFFPDIAIQIDWSKPYEFLDKELLAIEKKTRVGKRLSDSLVKVRKISGEAAWVIIHLEVQGGREKKFAQRMFEYFYKIYDRYKKPIMCATILTDQNKNWRPNCFEQALWGCELTLKYPIIKLADYEFEFLDKNNNPIAKVIQAHLAALKTRGNPEMRFENKLFLVKKLYPLGFTQEDIKILYTFMDYTLSLPPDLENEFMANMKNYEEEMNMPYITSAERIGKEIGKEEGILIGAHKMLQAQIEKKYGKLTPVTQNWLLKANSKELESLAIRILTAPSIDELFNLPVNDTTTV